MSFAVLLITKPAEAERLSALLRYAPVAELRVLTVTDGDEGLGPEHLLRQRRPDLLLLGAGQLGVDLAAYAEAARRELPSCAVGLIGDPALADTLMRLRPDHLLLRPVRREELFRTLQRRMPPLPSLLRADDLLPDLGPLFLYQEAPEPTPSKIAVDPSLYEDAFADIDLDSLEPVIEKSDRIAAPRRPVVSVPPPLPDDVRRTPPQSKATEPAQPGRLRIPRPIGQEGELAVHDPPTLIGHLCRNGFSGCLLLVGEGDRAQRALYFERGQLQGATSTLPSDSLPEFLHHEGRLSREQSKRAHRIFEEQGSAPTRQLAERLYRARLLKRAEIEPVLRMHVKEIFYCSIACEQGRYHLLPGPVPAEVALQLEETTKLLLLEGLRRRASLESLQKRIGSEREVLLPLGDGPQLLGDAGVTAVEQRALALFDGKHTLAEVAAASGLAEHATYVLAYALLCLGGLGQLPPEQEGPAMARGVPRRTPGAALRTAISAADAATFRERVRRRYRQVQFSDYYALLGIEPGATAAEIGTAYEAIKEELRAVPRGLAAEFGRELREIASVVDEAYSLLMDDQVQAAYRANLLPLSQP